MTGWGSWYFPMTSPLIGPNLAGGPAVGPGAKRTPDNLQDVMSRPFPGKAQVEKATKDAIGLLDREIARVSKVSLDGPAVERLIRELDAPNSWDSARSWDHAAQRYLALVPLNQAWKRLDPAQLSEQNLLAERLYRLLEKLGFKDELNSPRDYDPATVRLRP
jgi:hypothetical protein